MINAHIDEERAAPLWAAVGVPLLVVPLLVALLALLTPGPQAPAAEAGPSTTSDQVVEVQSADHAIATQSDCMQDLLVQS